MRKSFILWMLLTSVLAAGQTGVQDLARTMRPDINVVVTKHSSGADIVTVTASNPEYPPSLLEQQADAIGQQLRYAPTALQVHKVILNPADPKGGFVQATFGVNGLVDRNAGRLGLQCLARAFAGAPAPFTVHGIFIDYVTEAATPKNVQSYGGPNLSVQVSGENYPHTGIEYRIKLNTQDPAAIIIPEAGDIVVANKPVAKEPAGGSLNVLLLTAFVVAAIALGALVYSLLLPRPRPRPR